VVLLPGCLCFEIAPWLSRFVDSVLNRCAEPQRGWRNERSGHSGISGGALEGSLGKLDCVYGRMPSKPARYQHPPFQCALGVADATARAIAPNAKRTTRADALRGSAGSRGGCSACGQLPVHRRARPYPYYFPYINALGLGRPAYALVNDSNVDWNQSLPEVKHFALERGLQRIGLDAYGFSDATVSVPQARPWSCQRPTAEDEGQWVVLSANFILDGHNCFWLMQYPHEALAGGSMYAVHLPTPIPAAGSASGSPLPSAFREFGGAPFDIRGFFIHINQHPDDLPRGVEWMQTTFSNWNKSQGPPKPP
jgi:hypothetical protein